MAGIQQPGNPLQVAPSDASTLRHQLRAAGFCPLPLRGKAPFQKDWQKRTEPSSTDIDNWALHYPDAPNTGLLTRLMPTLDLDILNPEAVEAAEAHVREHYEERGYILVRIGLPPKRAIPFRTIEPFDKIVVNLIAPNARPEKIEFLGNGQQVVVAGIHPDTKQPYRWHGGELGQIKLEELPYIGAVEARQLVDDVVELLIRDFGYTRAPQRPKARRKGNGAASETDAGIGAVDWRYLFDNIRNGRALHDSLRDLAAKLIASGTSAGAAVNQMRALMESSTAPRDERWQVRFEDIPRLVATAKALQEREHEAQQPGLFDPWQEFIVPEFPLDVLPPVAQTFVTRRSTAMGVDPSAMAMATLAALSGAIHHRFRIKMMRNSWWEHMRLWVLLVGRPAWKKSPLIDATTRPIERHQAARMRDYRAELRDYRAAKKKDAGVEEPEPPERFTVGDITIEKLGEILSRSERGVLAKHDEMAGWIGRMERYHSAGKGASADRAFWLQSWNGGPYSIDRIKSGETFVQNLSVSIIGGIQPARLAELHGLSSDGLLQRFLPILMRAPRLPADIDCSEADKNYEALIYELIALPPQQLRTTDAAIEAMAELQDHVFKLEQVGEALSEGFEGFVGKLMSHAGVLTMILHLIDNPKEAVRNFIGQSGVEKVDRLIRNFLLPHAYEFYSVGEGESERLRKLASYILTCGKDRLRLAEFTTNVWDCRGKTVLEVNQQVSPLVAGGWLTPSEPGPACRAWDVSRAVIDAQFAERCRVEQERKLAVAQLMGAQRRVTPTGSGKV